MSATLTEFRLALQALLNAELELEFRPGKPPDDWSSEEQPLGFVWTTGKARGEDNAMDELLEAHVRVYTKFLASEVPEKPFDPTPLEELAEQVQRLLHGRAATFGPWWTSWIQTEIDVETQGIELTFVGAQQNVSLLPA